MQRQQRKQNTNWLEQEISSEVYVPAIVHDGSALPVPAARARSSAAALTRETFVFVGERSGLGEGAGLFGGIDTI
jgi:hypothetical protein